MKMRAPLFRSRSAGIENHRPLRGFQARHLHLLESSRWHRRDLRPVRNLLWRNALHLTKGSISPVALELQIEQRQREFLKRLFLQPHAGAGTLVLIRTEIAAAQNKLAQTSRVS